MSSLKFDMRSAADNDAITMIDLLRWRALCQGERLAYTFLVDGEAEKIDLTYGELDQRSRAIGATLQYAGAAGERVLLLYPHGLEFIAAFWGCLYAGAIAIPAYPPRINRSQLRLQKIIEDSQATIVLTAKSVLARVGRIWGEAPSVNGLRWIATDDITGEPEEKWQAPAINGGALAMIQYTSGSTSTPKGVMVSHRNLLHNERMIQQAFRQTENSIIVGWLPLYHDMGLIGNVLQPLFLGARCVLMSPTAFLQTPFRWLQAISDYRATTSGGPNFAYDLCARKIGPEDRARLDLSGWSVAFNGAEPIFEETMERFAATFAASGFRREAFHPCYGLAEATLLVTAGSGDARSGTKQQPIRQSHSMLTATAADQRVRVGCGRVLPGERVVIADPESLTLSPDERVGEIWVSGPNVACGYWNRDQETDRTFRAYLRDTGEGPFLRTGDLGYIKDGELYVAGRIKDLIIVRGRNHYPQDIELTVQQSDPALEFGPCAAFSVEQAGEEQLVIVQELNRDVPDPGFLIDGIRATVAREHEIQAQAIVLIGKGRMPKTTSGKIQRYECRNQYQAGALAAIVEWREGLTLEGKPAPLPSNFGLLPAIEDIETDLLLFLASRLRRHADHLSVNHPLLSYGVDSMTAIELSHRLESRFGVILPSAILLDDVTISQLARQALDQLKEGSRYSRPLLTPAPEAGARYPLSYGQRSLWFLHQLAPLSGVYNVWSAVRIRSSLDPRALKRTLQKIADRHDSLRTTFLSDQGEPLRKVHKKLEVSLLEMDISSWSEEILEDYLVEEAHRPFDLVRGPLLRADLFTRAPQDHILLVVAHHIVVDLWSMGALIHELGLFYRAEMDSTSAILDPLPFQYGDYVYWQTKWLESPAGEQCWSYWERTLAGDIETLNLPADRPRPPRQTFRGDSQAVFLNIDLAQALQSLGRQRRATLYMTLQAIFHALLCRYTAQGEIVIGSPMAGRSAADLTRLIGYFVNPVVLRTDLSGNPAFGAFLERVREMTLAALANQDFPFALLVERLQPTRDPSRPPLFQAMFALQKAPSLDEEGAVSHALIGGAPLKFGGLSAESVAVRRRTSYFDLGLFVVETEAGLKGFIEYNTDLFDEWRIQRMAEHLRTLAIAVTNNPEKKIQEFELMSPAEMGQMIAEFNQTAREYERARLIHELIEARADKVGDKTAVVDEWERVSYGELNRRANQLAGYLIKRGVGVEDRVGLCMNRGIEMIVGLLGILKAGAAYVPLDPTYPRERLEYMLTEAEVKTLVTRESLNDLFIGRREDRIRIDSDWPSIARESVGNPGREMWEWNLAYVIYTSGSTGKPKGAAITHRSAVTLLNWAGEAFSDEELNGVLASTSICFDLSVFELMAPLSRGGKVIVAENALSLPELKAAEEVKLINTVPSAIRELAGSGGIPYSAETVNLAGEALRNGLAQQMYEVGTVKRVVNLYGPTEDTTYSTWTVVAKGAEEEPSIGRPIANTKVYILDGAMRPTPIGVYGEIYIGGEGLARCYLNRPEITAEKFAPNPFGCGAGERVYRTGDIGRYGVDGEIEYFGRSDHQVKVRGYRIELGEIEGVLEEDEMVREAVVMAREDEGGDKRLVAYIVGEKGRGGEGEAKRLRKYLKDKLPDYLVPSAIVVLDKMPLTPNGKLDRKALPAPEQVRVERERALEAPRTPFEQIVVGVYEEVLRSDRVGIHDNFFEIGGHSLLATQVISRVRAIFGVEMGLGSIFEEATAAGLAGRIEEVIKAGAVEEAPPLVRVDRTERLPLSYAQQRLWFIEQLEPGSIMYNCVGATRLEGELNLEALEWVINEVIRRHEVLRTRIDVEGDAPVQVIEEWEPQRLELEDLRGVAPEERDEKAEQVISAESKAVFDLIRGPLMRVKLLKLGDAEHIMLIAMHHIVSDAWSIGVLAREVGELYEAAIERRASHLPELKIQYADYACWQRRYMTGAVLEGHLAYWKRQLAGDLPTLRLPTDHPHPATPSRRGATKTLILPAELSQSLTALSRREGVTLFILLLAAFKTLLYKYTAQEDIIIGATVANRTRAEIEPLIGFFVNMLPLRTDLSRDPKFIELLKRVKEVALGAYAHQDLPFEILVSDIHAAVEAPLFNVSFGVQNTPWEDLRLPGIRFRPMLVEQGGARFDLSLWVTEKIDGMSLCWTYSQDLFKEKTITRMHSHFETLLFSIVERPDARLTTLEISLKAESQSSNKSGDAQEDSNRRKLLSIKRRYISPSIKPT
jgi:amino acid adenylation domain-containing protein